MIKRAISSNKQIPRDKFVQTLRIHGLTLEQIGKRIGISKERVRCILARVAREDQDAIERAGMDLQEIHRRLQVWSWRKHKACH